MSKPIELTQSQIKALQSGATMFLFPINFIDDFKMKKIKDDYNYYNKIFTHNKKEQEEFEYIFSVWNLNKCTNCRYNLCISDCSSIVTFNIFNKTMNRDNVVDCINILDSPINKGDKDIFVKEEFQLNGYDFWNVIYKNTCLNIPTPFKWIPASQMTKEQSRYSFKECIDVKVVKVQDWMKYLNTKNKKAIESFTFHVSNEPISQKRRRAFELFYNQQLKEQNINRTYEDNDYVFLIEFA